MLDYSGHPMQVLRRLIVLSTLLLTASSACAEDFPRTIEHRYGSTVVTTKPVRVVTLSYIGHDFALALGIKPAGLRYWYGNNPKGVWPWAEKALGDEVPVVLSGQIDLERIAALHPDLIEGMWSGMTEAEYRFLSRIAPTLPPAADGGDYDMRWQEMTRVFGYATARETAAKEIIDRLEGKFAAVRAAHPDWHTKTAVMASIRGPETFTSRDVRSRFLAALGFRTPDAVDALAVGRSFYVRLSPEDLTPIDTDVLIWLNSGKGRPEFASQPLYPFLRAVRTGREVHADVLLSAALSHSSPLSLDYALSSLVPELEKVLASTSPSNAASAGGQNP